MCHVSDEVGEVGLVLITKRWAAKKKKCSRFSLRPKFNLYCTSSECDWCVILQQSSLNQSLSYSRGLINYFKFNINQLKLIQCRWLISFPANDFELLWLEITNNVKADAIIRHLNIILSLYVDEMVVLI